MEHQLCSCDHHSIHPTFQLQTKRLTTLPLTLQENCLAATMQPSKYHTTVSLLQSYKFLWSLSLLCSRVGFKPCSAREKQPSVSATVRAPHKGSDPYLKWQKIPQLKQLQEMYWLCIVHCCFVASSKLLTNYSFTGIRTFYVTNISTECSWKWTAC